MSSAITPAWGTSSDSNSSRLGVSSVPMFPKPVTLPPGRARGGRGFRGECRTGAADCDDQFDLSTDEIGSQGGQTIVSVLCPAVFDRQILARDIAGIAQPLLDR